MQGLDRLRTAIGLVPNSGWLEPCGETYSGDCDNTTPIKPRSASRRAQNLRAAKLVVWKSLYM